MLKKIILKYLVDLIRLDFFFINKLIKNLKKLNKFQDPNIFVYTWKIFDEYIYMKLHKSSYIDRQVLHNIKYSNNINFHILKKCKIETLYLDIGANVGTTSLPVAIHNKNIEVHAFEPNPKIFQSLEINKSLNNCDNLILHKVAVGLKKEKLPLFVTSKEKANFGNSSFQKNTTIIDPKTIDVEVIRIDDFFNDIKKPVSLIKIDVEGFEWQVIEGAKNIIKNHGPTIIFEHNDKFLNDPIKIKSELEQFFLSNGYEVFEIDQYDFNRLNPVNWKNNLKANLIAMKVNI